SSARSFEHLANCSRGGTRRESDRFRLQTELRRSFIAISMGTAARILDQIVGLLPVDVVRPHGNLAGAARDVEQLRRLAQPRYRAAQRAQQRPPLGQGGAEMAG